LILIKYDIKTIVILTLISMWINLFYDKYAGDISGKGDHHYSNEITKMISINDLEDGSYNYYVDKIALDVYNKKFTGNFALPECVYKSDLFKLMLYTKIDKSIETVYVVIGIDTNKLEKILIENKGIPPSENLDFLKLLCRYHMAYTETAKFINNDHYYNNKCYESGRLYI
jgi:hypothetical protein